MKKRFLTKIIILSFLLIIILSACTKEGDSSLYTNNEYGFSIEFPESWTGKFEVVPYDYGLMITSEKNDIGALAYIHKYTIQEWKELNYGSDIPVHFQNLGEDSEEIFVLIFPSDVNCNLEDKNSVEKNEEMTLDLMEENYTFNFLD